MPAQLYTGIETPSSATLTLAGITYRCHVWKDAASRSVQSRMMRVQADGAEVEVFRRVIYTTTADYGPDSVKIVAALETMFVVHWLEGGLDVTTPIDPVIRKSTIDLADFATAAWTPQGTRSVERFMHDLQPVIGDSDYLVAYQGAGDEPSLLRQNGDTWLDVVWDETPAGGATAARRAIACYGHAADNDAMIVYEGTGGAANEIYCARVDVDDGSAAAASQVFTNMPAVYLWQASMARTSANRVALVVEVSDIAETSYAIPIVGAVEVSSASADEQSDQHWWHHLRMLGQVFAFAGATDDDSSVNVYCLLGYKNATAYAEFSQQIAWVCNMDFGSWNAGANRRARPRPVSTFNLGDIDCRVTGSTADGGGIAGFAIGRRIGNLPAASGAPEEGRAVKTRTWSVLGFAKLMAMSSSGQPPLMPVAATVQGIRFHIEEPWTLNRDGSEPAAPSACFIGESPHTVGAAVEAAAGAVIGGGCPAYYDGHALVELGYPWAPEILDADDGAAGNLSVGAYLYCATFEHRDAAGQLHRSAPGAIFTHTTAGAVRVELEIGAMTLSMRDNAYHYPGASPINICLWRTEVGGLVFYRVFAQDGASNEASDTPENDPTVGYITATDNVADASLVLHEPLPYQLINGAFTPLPPYQPPASNAIAKWQNRVWLASSQDTRLLYYSQELLPEPGGTRTLPPEFNPALVVRIDGLGRVVAMEPRDQELILFTSGAIYSLTGIGADGAGANASYQVTELARGIGCIDARSIVSTAAGIFFQGHHGLYCLTGGGIEHVQIGAKVLDVIRTGGNLRGACYLKDRAAVRWVSNGAPAGEPLMLEYDLQHGRWSVSPLQLGDQPGGSDEMCATVGSTVWMGHGREALHAVVQAGALLLERATDDATPYADQNRLGNVAVPLRVQLNPIHLDGINGFVSLRRVAMAFEKPDESAYQIYHYSWRRGPYEDVVGWNHSYSSPAPERPRPYGPRYQKCAAFWLDFRELADPTIPATENVRIIGLQIEVGTMRGLRKD